MEIDFIAAAESVGTASVASMGPSSGRVRGDGDGASFPAEFQKQMKRALREDGRGDEAATPAQEEKNAAPEKTPSPANGQEGREATKGQGAEQGSGRLHDKAQAGPRPRRRARGAEPAPELAASAAAPVAAATPTGFSGALRENLAETAGASGWTDASPSPDGAAPAAGDAQGASGAILGAAAQAAPSTAFDAPAQDGVPSSSASSPASAPPQSEAPAHAVFTAPSAVEDTFRPATPGVHAELGDSADGASATGGAFDISSLASAEPEPTAAVAANKDLTGLAGAAPKAATAWVQAPPKGESPTPQPAAFAEAAEEASAGNAAPQTAENAASKGSPPHPAVEVAAEPQAGRAPAPSRADAAREGTASAARPVDAAGADADAQMESAGQGARQPAQGNGAPTFADAAERLQQSGGDAKQGFDLAKEIASAAGAQTKAAAPSSSAPATAAGTTTAEEAAQSWLDAQERGFAARVAGRIQLQLRDGGDAIRVQLRPENLGRMEIRAEQGRDGILARITTESREAKALLEGSLSSLQQALEERGLKVDRLHVMTRAEADASGFAEDGSRSGQPWADRRDRPDGRFAGRGAGVVEVPGAILDGGADDAAARRSQSGGFYTVA